MLRPRRARNRSHQLTRRRQPRSLVNKVDYIKAESNLPFPALTWRLWTSARRGR